MKAYVKCALVLLLCYILALIAILSGITKLDENSSKLAKIFPHKSKMASNQLNSYLKAIIENGRGRHTVKIEEHLVPDKFAPLAKIQDRKARLYAALELEELTPISYSQYRLYMAEQRTRIIRNYRDKIFLV